MKNRLISISLALFMASNIFAQSYKDNTLSPSDRADDLLKRMTLEEKVSMMMDSSKPIEHLGIKKYNWWNEALHGVARSGFATVFPQPIGLAATFDDKSIYDVFTAASDEARAKNTYFASKGEYERYQGLTFWTPNVNIYRDPRWGRGIETYGEDPYLTSVMGVNVVNALQGNGSNSKYDKLHACAKHFAVHSGPEWNRHSFNAENISPRDLYETYLPAFKALVQEANVKEVMCAYNRFEGEPCCGNNRLLTNILREEWGYKGIIVSDCWAISDFYTKGAHETHKDRPSASSAAVLSGTDLECGPNYASLTEGVKKGMIKESDIDRSVKRLLEARFELGEMDDPALVPWTKIPYSVVCSAEHDYIALKAARESMTLLMNKNNILPLSKEGGTIAVIGPNANDSVMQWGNYNGTPRSTVTILDGIKSIAGNSRKIVYDQVCSWVEDRIIQSVFNMCSSNGKTGFSAEYWNNTTQSGKPDVAAHVAIPFRFCTSGATVFAPGVNLTDFSARYKSQYTADSNGDIVFETYLRGNLEIEVNGKIIGKYREDHGGRKFSKVLTVEKGKKYNIVLNFKYSSGDAQLDFDLGFKREVDIPQTIERLKGIDTVIFVGGVSPSLEGEEMGVNLPGFRGGDRTDIELPMIQRRVIESLQNAGKKVIFVCCSGSPIAIEKETENCQAILQAWYPGQEGGKAVAEVLFGDYNPAGRLPVTMYRNTQQLPDFEDYNMNNRTYRYFKGSPLFAFGHGLSYSDFVYGQPKLSSSTISRNETLKVTIPVTNNSKLSGDEVVQLYLKRTDDAQGPIKELRAFKRINIRAGATAEVELTLAPKQFEWWDEKNNVMSTREGNFQIFIGNSSDDANMKSINVEIK